MLKNLILSVITIFCVLYRIEVVRCSSNNVSVNIKFCQAGIIPDIIEDLPIQLKFLSIVYPSQITVNLGNILTPTQTKKQPKIACDLDKASVYTLLMTGRYYKVVYGCCNY